MHYYLYVQIILLQVCIVLTIIAAKPVSKCLPVPHENFLLGSVILFVL